MKIMDNDNIDNLICLIILTLQIKSVRIFLEKMKILDRVSKTKRVGLQSKIL